MEAQKQTNNVSHREWTTTLKKQEAGLALITRWKGGGGEQTAVKRVQDTRETPMQKRRNSRRAGSITQDCGKKPSHKGIREAKIGGVRKNVVKGNPKKPLL